MRWLGAALVLFPGGCVEDAAVDGGGRPAPSAFGQFEPTEGGGEWLGNEIIEWSRAEVPDCGLRRDLVGHRVEAAECAGCELALKVVEALAPDADGACEGSDGLLQAGEALFFAPHAPNEAAGVILVDRGDGPEELGTGTFDGTTLWWRRER